MLTRVLALAAAVLLPSMVEAQTAGYPSQTIRVIVPTRPGASPDILARIIGHHLSPRIGQQVVVVNQPGGGGNIGHANAAKANPDGYTLLVTSDALSINDTLFPNLPFKSADYVPVIQAIESAQILVTSPKLPAKNVAELVAYAKANPGKLNFASPQLGTLGHLTGELMKMTEKIDIVHIPFPGAPVALQEVMSGNVHMLWVTLPPAVGPIKQGSVRAMAVSTARRAEAVPDVPTMRELGYTHYDFASWQGVLLPPGSPREIALKLNAEINAVLKTPEASASLSKIGFDPVGGTVDEFGKVIAETSTRWGKVVREAGIKPN